MRFREKEPRLDGKKYTNVPSPDFHCIESSKDHHHNSPRLRERSPPSHHSLILSCKYNARIGTGAVRYRECLKNQAAGIGETAYDGCCDFIPNTSFGADPVECAACGCDRTFHRIEPASEDDSIDEHVADGKKPDPSGTTEEEEVLPKEENSPPPTSVSKKRFKTKFTAEQKEKMKRFADEIGWKVSNRSHEEIEKFCSEIGVKKVKFRVWMNNNRAKGK